MTERDAPGARSRLLRRLDTTRSIAIVWGPAGYGKSTLVDTWLAAHPDLRTVLLDASAHAPGDFWDAAERAADVADVVVLRRPDRYRDPQSWARLTRLARNGPECRFVVTVRDAGFFWAGVGSVDDATFVTPADLEFTVDDIVDMYSARDLTVTPRTARDVQRAAEGHPTVIALAEHVIRIFGRELEFEREHAYATLEDYIDHQVRTAMIDPLPRVQRDGLFTVAVLRRITLGAVAALGVDDPAGLLADLEVHGAVRRMPSARDIWWVVPAAVRRSLLRIAESEGGVSMRDLAGVAARWYADRGEPAEALRYATDGRDWDLVVGILAASWPDVATLRPGVVHRALAALPAEVADTHPALHHARELVSRMAGGGVGAVAPSRFDDVSLEEIAERESVDVALVTGVLRSVLMRWAGDFEQALRDRDVLVDLATRAEATSERSGARLAIVWMNLGLACHYRGDEEAATDLLSRAADRRVDGADHLVVRKAIGQLALLGAVAGEHRRAARWIRRESEFADGAGRIGALVGLPALTARALAEIDHLDVAAAERTLAALPELDENVENWAFVVYARSQLDLVLGRPEVGLDRLHRARSRFRKWLPPTAFADPLLGSLSMELRTAAGEAAMVTHRSERVREPMHPMVRLAAARAAAITGDRARALAHCAELTRSPGTTARVVLDALLVEATVRLAGGEDDAARVAFARAVALAHDTGAVAPFAAVPPDALAALQSLGGPLPAQWTALLGSRRLFPDPAPAVALTDREQVVLAGLVRGEALARIAESLYVSPNTVKSQVRSLYRKLGVHSRSEAVDVARRRGLARDGAPR